MPPAPGPANLRSLRVVFVTWEFPPHGNGIGSYTQKTAQALAAAGHKVDVITVAHDGQPRTEVEQGVRLHRLPGPKGRPRYLFRAWQVARVLRGWNRSYDIVQACEWGAEASIYALRPDAPLITRLATPHFLTDDLNEAPRAARLRHLAVGAAERLQTKLSSRVISPSQAMAEVIARDWALPFGRITIVPTGVRVPPMAVAETPDIGAQPYLLYFGRLEFRKGVDVLIDALPNVLARVPHIAAVFVGEDVGNFRELAARRCAPYRDRLRFLPRLAHEELFPLIAHARLVVLPSRWENLANACLEAMAFGRPVIATTGCAFEEMIVDNVSGFLVPPGDPVALGKAIRAALTDEARLESVGQAARARALTFELDEMAARLVAVYRDVLARS